MEVSCKYTRKAVRRLTRGSPPVSGFGMVLTIPHHKRPARYKMLHKALDSERFFGTTEQWKMSIIYRIWNVRSLYRSDQLKIIARELVQYKLI
jgi:hypothetical protein